MAFHSDRTHPTAPVLLWMNNRRCRHHTMYDPAIEVGILRPPLSPAMEPRTVAAAMTEVADWQMANEHRIKHPPRDWTWGALLAGMTAWALTAEDGRYLEWLRDRGRKNEWKLGDRRYHADDHAVGATYLALYRQAQDVEMLTPTKRVLDQVLAKPSEVSLEYGPLYECRDRWSWCDELFMGPPVWAAMSTLTGDERYLNLYPVNDPHP
jgi:rhamnogalacturonyl hydrolase YesR